MTLPDFVEMVKAAGPVGLAVGLIVLVIVFALAKAGVVVTGDQKRIANVVLTILLAGLNFLNPEALDVLVAAIASVGSAALYELLKWIFSKSKAAIKASRPPF